jgi:hypothetical protein
VSPSGTRAAHATKRHFIVKFDTQQNPELQTSAGVIVNRIFWTAGYNVPSDTVFTFRKEQLQIEPGATYSTREKHKRPFDTEEMDEVLHTAAKQKDGSYRALASQLLQGVPKGGFSPDSTRGDDANDRVRHEHRRELRGLRVLSAWVSHTDMKEDNTLDMYVEEGGRKYLKHYLLDFGEALDGHGAEKGRKEDGWENFVDWEMQSKAMLAFGLWKRPWEDIKPTPWPSVGSFTAYPFDPQAWREAYPFWRPTAPGASASAPPSNDRYTVFRLRTRRRNAPRHGAAHQRRSQRAHPRHHPRRALGTAFSR